MNLKRNVVAVMFQTASTAICLFLSYRILVTEMSVEMLGLWSLLLSMTSLFRMADISGGSALSRFLALPPDTRPGSPSKTVSTVVLTSLAINGFFALLFYLLAQIGLIHFIDKRLINAASALLPWISVLFVLSSLAAAFAAGLDGSQRADLRAYVLASAAVFSLLLTWLLVPTLKATGFAIAQAAQQVIIIVAGWILLRRQVPGLGILPLNWDFGILRKTLPYTLSLNVTGIAALLFEPLAKFALNSSGGPVLVGHFELGNKVCAMLRGIAVSAAVPLVPAFAAYSQHDDPALASRVSTAHRWFALLAIGVVIASTLASPIVSYLVLGKIELDILQMTAILAAGWSINMLAAPTYMAAQGQGLLRWNILSHIVLGACVVAGASVVSAPFVSPVVWSICGGLIISACVIIAGNLSALGNTVLLRRDLPVLFGAGTLCVAISAASLWLVKTP